MVSSCAKHHIWASYDRWISAMCSHLVSLSFTGGKVSKIAISTFGKYLELFKTDSTDSIKTYSSLIKAFAAYSAQRHSTNAIAAIATVQLHSTKPQEV